MGSSDLFPEKFGMYFASMSPLASKIYADIEGIEDYIKSHGPPSITYSEKCNIVDKFLIYDHLNKNDANGKLNKRLSEYQKFQLHKSETSLNSILDKDTGLMSEAELVQPVYYNDPTLDQDHESVLLTTVAPKKPEKYVYDDNNYWIDEHSGTYSSCTVTQAKACKLHEFLESLPPPPQPIRRHSDHPHKYRAPPIPTFKGPEISMNDDDHEQEEEEEDDESYIIRPSRKTSMSGIEDDEGRYSKIDKMHSEKSKAKAKHTVAVPLFGGLFEDAVPTQKKAVNETENGNNEQDLPNQVKNTDLIAELQAKLKKGKTPTATDGISPRSSTKLNKPKAPPPPPPGNVKPPGGAVKVTEVVSSPEKNKPKNKEASSKKPTKETGATSSLSSQFSKKSPEREITDDFVVDVSSPCKIVTRKTGLDFLDNW